MDSIKSWYQYFRGNNTNGSKDNLTAELKNDLKHNDNEPSKVETNPRNGMDIRFNNDIINVSGGSENHSNQSDLRSHMDSFWEFHNDIFSITNEMFKEFFNQAHALHNEFPPMPNFFFDNFPNLPTPSVLPMNDGTGRGGKLTGESLKDYYLRVPDLEALKSNSNHNALNVINPNRDSGGIVNSGPANSTPNSSDTGSFSLTSFGPMVEVKTVKEDSNGKTTTIHKVYFTM